MQVPWAKGCLHPDCVGTPGNQACQGNILEVRGSELWMILSHHKNQVRWEGTKIQFRIPPELKQMLEAHLARAHAIVSYGCPFVFTTARGHPMTEPAQMTAWWEAMQRERDCPVVFPPNR